MVECALPWHDKVHFMAKQYGSFCVAARNQYPASHFVKHVSLGLVGTHESVAASFLVHLRFKGGDPLTSTTRKVSTLKNLLWLTKAGLRQAFAQDLHNLPGFCKPRPSPVLAIDRLVKVWQKVDMQNQPTTKHLLEADIESYCLHTIWEHMQCGEGLDFNPVRLLQALVLRIQSGSGARHTSTSPHPPIGLVRA